MDTPTIVVTAKRVITHIVAKRMIMMIYQPNRATVSSLQAYPKDAGVHIDINDETGEFTTAATWQIEKCDVSDDSKSIVLVIRM